MIERRKRHKDRYNIDWFIENAPQGTMIVATLNSCIVVRKGIILRNYTLDHGNVADYKGD